MGDPGEDSRERGWKVKFISKSGVAKVNRMSSKLLLFRILPMNSLSLPIMPLGLQKLTNKKSKYMLSILMSSTKRNWVHLSN